MNTPGTLPRGYSFEWNHWVYRCPEKDCYYGRQVKEEGADVQHKCPESNGSTKIGWSVYGPSLLEQTWAELDAVTARLVSSPAVLDTESTADREIDKGYARGLAFTLSLFMVPHFATPKDVAREAKKRYDMKQAGEEYCTPGLASRKYEAPPADHKLDTRPEQPTRRAAPKQKSLGDTEVAAIKNAAAMFSVDELAKVYGISVARVKEIIG